MAINVKASVINYHQHKSGLNDINFYQEFAGRIHGLKTAKATNGRNERFVDEILREQGLMQFTATQAQKDNAIARAEDQATVMLYLRNINQSWHGLMDKYLEDAYATGNDIYPTLLPDAYCFMDDWKEQHQTQRKFTGGSEGITMATAGNKQKEGNNARFVILGKEHVLCWDCNYYGHRRGHKICPNYDPLRPADARGQKTQQVNVTSGNNTTPVQADSGAANNPNAKSTTMEVSSLTSQGQEAAEVQSRDRPNNAAWTVPAAMGQRMSLSHARLLAATKNILPFSSRP